MATKRSKWDGIAEKLKLYCKNKGWDLEFSPLDIAGESDIYNKKIIISDKHSKENACYILLHEIGHLLVSEEEHYKEKYYAVQQGYSPRSLVKKVSIIEEEFSAWFSGQQLAEKLGIKLNKKNWLKLRAKYINTYL